MLYKSLSFLYYTGMALLFISIILLLTDISGGLIIYTIGAIPIVSIRIFNRAVCKPDRRRTNTILVVSSLFLIAAGATNYLKESYWIVFILITAALDFYISFRKIK